MYRVRTWGDSEIKEVEAIKISDKTVWFINGYTNKEDRELRDTQYHKYFETKDEAVLWLKNKWEDIINSSEKKISNAKENLRLLGF